MPMLGVLLICFLIFCVAAAFTAAVFWILFWTFWFFIWVLGIMIHIGFWIILLALCFGVGSWICCAVRDLFR